MTSQIRDTEFGHLVRLVTENRFLQYDDEVDLAKCQAALAARAKHTESTDRSKPAEDQQGTLEKGEPTLLVDWYGADDPEVCRSIPTIPEDKGRQTDVVDRIPKTGPPTGNSSSPCKYA